MRLFLGYNSITRVEAYNKDNAIEVNKTDTRVSVGTKKTNTAETNTEVGSISSKSGKVQPFGAIGK